MPKKHAAAEAESTPSSDAQRQAIGRCASDAGAEAAREPRRARGYAPDAEEEGDEEAAGAQAAQAGLGAAWSGAGLALLERLRQEWNGLVGALGPEALTAVLMHDAAQMDAPTLAGLIRADTASQVQAIWESHTDWMSTVRRLLPLLPALAGSYTRQVVGLAAPQSVQAHLEWAGQMHDEAQDSLSGVVLGCAALVSAVYLVGRAREALAGASAPPAQGSQSAVRVLSGMHAVRRWLGWANDMFRPAGGVARAPSADAGAQPFAVGDLHLHRSVAVMEDGDARFFSALGDVPASAPGNASVSVRHAEERIAADAFLQCVPQGRGISDTTVAELSRHMERLHARSGDTARADRRAAAVCTLAERLVSQRSRPVSYVDRMVADWEVSARRLRGVHVEIEAQHPGRGGLCLARFHAVQGDAWGLAAEARQSSWSRLISEDERAALLAAVRTPAAPGDAGAASPSVALGELLSPAMSFFRSADADAGPTTSLIEQLNAVGRPPACGQMPAPSNPAPPLGASRLQTFFASLCLLGSSYLRVPGGEVAPPAGGATGRTLGTALFALGGISFGFGVEEWLVPRVDTDTTAAPADGLFDGIWETRRQAEISRALDLPAPVEHGGYTEMELGGESYFALILARLNQEFPDWLAESDEALEEQMIFLLGAPPAGGRGKRAARERLTPAARPGQPSLGQELAGECGQCTSQEVGSVLVRRARDAAWAGATRIKMTKGKFATAPAAEPKLFVIRPGQSAESLSLTISSHGSADQFRIPYDIQGTVTIDFSGKHIMLAAMDRRSVEIEWRGLPVDGNVPVFLKSVEDWTGLWGFSRKKLTYQVGSSLTLILIGHSDGPAGSQIRKIRDEFEYRVRRRLRRQDSAACLYSEAPLCKTAPMQSERINIDAPLTGHKTLELNDEFSSVRIAHWPKAPLYIRLNGNIHQWSEYALKGARGTLSFGPALQERLGRTESETPGHKRVILRLPGEDHPVTVEGPPSLVDSFVPPEGGLPAGGAPQQNARDATATVVYADAESFETVHADSKSFYVQERVEGGGSPRSTLSLFSSGAHDLITIDSRTKGWVEVHFLPCSGAGAASRTVRIDPASVPDDGSLLLSRSQLTEEWNEYFGMKRKQYSYRIGENLRVVLFFYARASDDGEQLRIVDDVESSLCALAQRHATAACLASAGAVCRTQPLIAETIVIDGNIAVAKTLELNNVFSPVDVRAWPGADVRISLKGNLNALSEQEQRLPSATMMFFSALWGQVSRREETAQGRKKVTFSHAGKAQTIVVEGAEATVDALCADMTPIPIAVGPLPPPPGVVYTDQGEFSTAAAYGGTPLRVQSRPGGGESGVLHIRSCSIDDVFVLDCATVWTVEIDLTCATTRNNQERRLITLDTSGWPPGAGPSVYLESWTDVSLLSSARQYRYRVGESVLIITGYHTTMPGPNQLQTVRNNFRLEALKKTATPGMAACLSSNATSCGTAPMRWENIVIDEHIPVAKTIGINDEFTQVDVQSWPPQLTIRLNGNRHQWDQRAKWPPGALRFAQALGGKLGKVAQTTGERKRVIFTCQGKETTIEVEGAAALVDKFLSQTAGIAEPAEVARYREWRQWHDSRSGAGPSSTRLLKSETALSTALDDVIGPDREALPQAALLKYLRNTPPAQAVAALVDRLDRNDAWLRKDDDPEVGRNLLQQAIVEVMFPPHYRGSGFICDYDLFAPENARRPFAEIRAALSEHLQSFFQLPAIDAQFFMEILLPLFAPELLLDDVPDDFVYEHNPRLVNLRHGIALAAGAPSSLTFAGLEALPRERLTAAASDAEKEAVAAPLQGLVLDWAADFGVIDYHDRGADYPSQDAALARRLFASARLADIPNRVEMAIAALQDAGIDPGAIIAHGMETTELESYLNRGAGYSHPSLPGKRWTDMTQRFEEQFGRYVEAAQSLYEEELMQPFLDALPAEHRARLQRGQLRFYGVQWREDVTERADNSFSPEPAQWEDRLGRFGGILHLEDGDEDYLYAMFSHINELQAMQITSPQVRQRLRAGRIKDVLSLDLQYRYPYDKFNGISRPETVYPGWPADGRPLNVDSSPDVVPLPAGGGDNLTRIKTVFSERLFMSGIDTLRALYKGETRAEQKARGNTLAGVLWSLAKNVLPVVGCFDVQSGGEAVACAIDVVPAKIAGVRSVSRVLLKGAKNKVAFFRAPQRINGKIGYPMGAVRRWIAEREMRAAGAGSAQASLGDPSAFDMDDPRLIVDRVLDGRRVYFHDYVRMRYATSRLDSAAYQLMRQRRIATRPFHPELYNIRPGDARAVIDTVFSGSNRGLLIGESHRSVAALQFLIDNMGYLQQKGVKTLYLEFALREAHFSAMDAFNRGGPLPTDAIIWTEGARVGHGFPTNQPYRIEALFIAARNAGIDVIPTDNLAAFSSMAQTRMKIGLPLCLSRQRTYNLIAAQTIEQRQATNGNAPWVALVGVLHGLDGVPEHGVQGMVHLTNSLCVFVKYPHEPPRGFPADLIFDV